MIVVAGLVALIYTACDNLPGAIVALACGCVLHMIDHEN